MHMHLPPHAFVVACLIVCFVHVYMHTCIRGSHYYVHVDIWYVFLTCSCSWIKVDGNEYKLETGVIIEVLTDDMPTIGVIKKIFLINGQTFFFRLNAYKCTYDAHFRAYILDDDATCQMISYSSLFHPGTVHIRTSHIHELYNSFVILPFALCTP